MNFNIIFNWIKNPYKILMKTNIMFKLIKFKICNYGRIINLKKTIIYKKISYNKKNI